MQIRFHHKFKKTLKKQSPKIQNKFLERLDIFSADQYDHILNNHALKGKFFGWRSFNITGDVCVHYEEVGDLLILMDIGAHPQLYK